MASALGQQTDGTSSRKIRVHLLVLVQEQKKFMRAEYLFDKHLKWDFFER